MNWPSTLIPISIGASISPMMFSEQLLLVASRNGRRYGLAFAGGAATVLAVLVVLVLRFGGSIRLPHAPHLSATLDLVIGVILIVIARKIWRRGAKSADTVSQQKSPAGTPAAYGFGLFSMATNFTTLPLIAAGAKDISAAGMSDVWLVVASGVLVTGGCLPAVTPLVLERIPGGSDVLAKVSSLLHKYGKTFTVLVMAGIGALFVAEAIWAWASSEAFF